MPVRLLVTLVCLWFLAAETWGQIPLGLSPSAPTDAAESSETPPPLKPVDPRLRSPRATLQTFYDALDRNDLTLAANCLDLSALNQDTAKVLGPERAYYLGEVLARVLVFDAATIASISDEAGAPSPYLLEKHFFVEAENVPIALVRMQNGEWRFSEETVKEIAALERELREISKLDGIDQTPVSRPPQVWLRDQFPARLHTVHFLLPDYQWLCLLALIFIGFLADLLLRYFLRFATRAWFLWLRPGTDFQARPDLWKPVGRLANALIWYVGTQWIGLPDMALMVLLAALKLFTIFAAVWTVFTFTDLLGDYLARQAGRTATKFDDLLIPLVTKSIKIFAVCMGLITAATVFDLPVVGLFGSLGLGGLAMALAAKDAVSNLFGSFTVLVDRPFEVGDWVVLPNAEGTVETVGFRSTRIRTFYNSLITVPNSNLTTAVVDNMGRRRYRRIKTTLGVQYDTTPAQVDAFCVGIREIIRRHPYTRKDYYQVYLNDFGASSLDIMLYCFVQCPDWSTELRERHRLLLDILRLAEKLGVSFAFPTRKLHLLQEDPPPPPPALGDPEQAGQLRAKELVGSFVPPDQRDGPVRFPGPPQD